MTMGIRSRCSQIVFMLSLRKNPTHYHCMHSLVYAKLVPFTSATFMSN